MVCSIVRSLSWYTMTLSLVYSCHWTLRPLRPSSASALKLRLRVGVPLFCHSKEIEMRGDVKVQHFDELRHGLRGDHTSGHIPRPLACHACHDRSLNLNLFVFSCPFSDQVCQWMYDTTSVADSPSHGMLPTTTVAVIIPSNVFFPTTQPPNRQGFASACSHEKVRSLQSMVDKSLRQGKVPGRSNGYHRLDGRSSIFPLQLCTKLNATS